LNKLRFALDDQAIERPWFCKGKAELKEWFVPRQNSIRAENGAILLSLPREESELYQALI
jgi:hypothetical protein